MKVIFSLLAILFLLTSCSDDNQNRFVEVEDVIETVTAIEEPASPSEEDNEMIEFIEFNIDEHDIVLDIERIPILYEFLQGQQNVDEAVSDMELERIPIDYANIYTLRFSCVNERCSYLLLHEDQDKQPFLVADMANYVSSYISPDQSKIALHFNRFLGTDTITVSNLVIIDTENWENLPITNDDPTISLLNYSWPFVSVEWMDEESVAISIPDLVELNKDSYDEWSAAEKHSVTTILYYIKEE